MAISILRPGDPSWVVPDEELHSHFNDVEREMDTLLYGRRMYELMAGYWPTADQDPSAPGPIVEYAQIWKPVPKVVFSSTLERRLELASDKRGWGRRSRTTESAARRRVHGRRGPPPRLRLGIRRPDRRIPPLLRPDLLGFRKGSVLTDSEQSQTQARRDPHILFRDGTPEMRSHHSVV
jgi:hypothetical protein